MRLGNPEIQRLMGDTLGSVQITASSGPGGAITFRLPGGQTINSPLRLPVVTIPALSSTISPIINRAVSESMADLLR